MLTEKKYVQYKELLDSSEENNKLLSEMQRLHYNSLSIVSHDAMNHLSFLRNAFEFISKKNPETKDYKFWQDLGDTIETLIDYTERLALCRYCMIQSFEELAFSEIITSFTSQDSFKKSYCKINPDDASQNFSNVYINCDKKNLVIALNELLANTIEACEANDEWSYEDSNAPHIDILTENNNVVISFISKGNLPEIDLSKNIKDIINTNPGETYGKNSTDILCQPFYTTKPNHIGVGLYVVLMTVRNMNGTLKINEENNTTTVTITLPCIIK